MAVFVAVVDWVVAAVAVVEVVVEVEKDKVRVVDSENESV